MKKRCANCQKILEIIAYIDFHMTGKNLCERCSLESEHEVYLDSLKQAKRKLKDYEDDYKLILGEESEEYLSLIDGALKAIYYYEEQLQIVKRKINYFY